MPNNVSHADKNWQGDPTGPSVAFKTHKVLWFLTIGVRWPGNCFIPTIAGVGRAAFVGPRIAFYRLFLDPEFQMNGGYDENFEADSRDDSRFAALHAGVGMGRSADCR